MTAEERLLKNLFNPHPTSRRNITDLTEEERNVMMVIIAASK